MFLFFIFFLLKQLASKDQLSPSRNDQTHTKQFSAIFERKEEEEQTQRDKTNSINQFQMQSSNFKQEADQQKASNNNSRQEEEGIADKDIFNKRTNSHSKKNTFFSSVPQQNSFIQFEDKPELNDDKETVVDISFISQSSNKQQFANRFQGLQQTQFNKNIQSTLTNKIEILNNTDLSIQNKFVSRQNQMNNQDQNQGKLVEQSFSNQNTDASKNSSLKRDDKSENTQKISSTEVYSIPGPKNINSSQYQYVQANQLKSLNQMQMSNYQQVQLSTNISEINQNPISQKSNILVQNQFQNDSEITQQNKQNYKQFTLLDQQLNMYPTQDILVGDDTIENLEDPQFQLKYRLNLMKIFNQMDLKETQKQKLLKEQYCIHKTEYYEVDIKSSTDKNKKGTKNLIVYHFIIKNKTLSNIKEVSISLHTQPTSIIYKPYLIFLKLLLLSNILQILLNQDHALIKKMVLIKKSLLQILKNLGQRKIDQ